MNLSKVLNDAISKGALAAIRKPMANLRRDVAELKRQTADLKRLVRSMQREPKRNGVKSAAQEAEIIEPTRIRPTGLMVRKLRQRLGLTQVELSKLIGVSGLTISKWESADGRIGLRARTLEALAKVKGMGKREAVKALVGE